METITINMLFRMTKLFEIPSYQRAYSWDNEQIGQFIDDLNDTKDHYYLGNLLFEEHKGNKDALLVIDGQQRLTTCVIFISVVYRELQKRKNTGAKFAINLKKMHDRYMMSRSTGTPRFKTVEYDQLFFHNEIIESKSNPSTAGTKSQSRIRTAKELFEEKCSHAATPTLLKWYDLVEQARITRLIVQEKAEDAQLFALQNDRGKDLTVLERLKSYFMRQIYLLEGNADKRDEIIERLEERFRTIYQIIEEIFLYEDTVLLYYWRARSERGLSGRISKIREILDRQGEGKIEWIEDFVRRLSEAFLNVKKIEETKFPHSKYLFALDQMALAWPFLIRAYDVGASDTTIKRLIRLLENIIFRDLLRRGWARLEKRINSYLVLSTSEKTIKEQIESMLDTIRNAASWKHWRDAEMEKNLNDGYFYDQQPSKLKTYILHRYEVYLSRKEYPSGFEKIEREAIAHIAPKTEPEGNDTGYGVYSDESNPDAGIESGEWLHSLGNLVLVSKVGSGLNDNSPFQKKLKRYGESSLHQQKEIERFASTNEQGKPLWDKAAIERRRNHILKAAKEIWSLDAL